MSKQKVHFVSLGCPKNRVDSEVMLGHLSQEGYEHTQNPQEADVIVVNTCGFIDAAKEESVDTILEMTEFKKLGSAKKIVVAGCLSQRYAPDLAQEIPEVDHFLGTGNFETIAQVLKQPHKAPTRASLPIIQSDVTQTIAKRKEHPRLVGKNKLVPFKHEATEQNPIHIPDPDFTLTAKSPRVASTPSFSTYLKISEGCSNTCAFCIIPKLRGPQRSRPIADVLEEAKKLILQGAVEINLIAQDLCAYGKDLEPKQSLAQLLRELDALGAQRGRPLWIRCMYAYPTGLTDEVIDVMANATCIVPYLDMPLQHISDKLLRNMKRGKGAEATRELVQKLRTRIPNITFRTTFITGLPGETEEDFQELYQFVQESRFERLGVFAYSQEDQTPAANMPDQVPTAIAEQRRDAIMALQRDISQEQQQAMLGKNIQVLVEGISEESELLLQGRHIGQAPDIDGLTYITGGTATPGDIVTILVDQAGDYDVAGEIVSNSDHERALS